MPRDLPVGNSRLLVNFDKSYNLRDIYWPHVGQELHTKGNLCRTGVWVSGQFTWLDAPAWQRTMVYEDETLVTHITLFHPELKMRVVFSDTVDFNRSILLRHFVVNNLADHPREVRFFFHYDWYIWDAADANTVFYYPSVNALIAYKRHGYFLMNGQVGNSEQAKVGISSWATGIKEFNGAEGTWRDAEDGELGRNAIAQGSVDSTIALHLPILESGASGEAFHWLAAGQNVREVEALDGAVRSYKPEVLFMRTRNYWFRWVNKDDLDFTDLSPKLVKLYKQSLLILRTQIDHAGGIIAGNDADVEHFSNDTYSYMWPRDGAIVANALSHAGYAEVTNAFYQFCDAVLTPDGYLLHKYNPDRSWGSSWQAWIDKDGHPELPIQEDETALVLYSLWQHYNHFHDVEFVAPYYHSLITPAAAFLVNYRDETTKLPAPSFDLWEERRGILAYTTSAVYAGLEAATNFAQIFGEEEQANKYRQAAQEIKEAVMRYLWDEECGHFLRMITVNKDGSIQKDTTLDSSLCGLFQFGMLSVHDPHMERTMQTLEQTLWVKTEIGGIARYENDYYYQSTRDLGVAQGNPWFVCTLWLAQYRIAHANSLDELHQALPLLEWACIHALPSGVMAEQAHPFTGEPLSVSPLTWSHAEYVLTVRWYLGRYRRFMQ